MPRAVVLLHTLPNGASHYDWLLAREGDEEGGGAGPCATFRLQERPDQAMPGSAAPAERIPDHRAHYLTYEGPVSGGRGEVRRVAEGVCRIVREADREIEAVVEWRGGPTRRYAASAERGSAWLVRTIAAMSDERR